MISQEENGKAVIEEEDEPMQSEREERRSEEEEGAGDRRSDEMEEKIDQEENHENVVPQEEEEEEEKEEEQGNAAEELKANEEEMDLANHKETKNRHEEKENEKDDAVNDAEEEHCDDTTENDVVDDDLQMEEKADEDEMKLVESHTGESYEAISDTGTSTDGLVASNIGELVRVVVTGPEDQATAVNEDAAENAANDTCRTSEESSAAPAVIPAAVTPATDSTVTPAAVTHATDSTPRDSDSAAAVEFLAKMESEKSRLACLCTEAERDLTCEGIPDAVCGRIRTAIGKSQLLTGKKFKQFAQLCHDCMDPKPGKCR